MSIETATARGVVDDGQTQQKIVDDLAALLGVGDDQPPEEEATDEAAPESDSTDEKVDDEPIEETEAEDTDESERAETEQEIEDQRWMPESIDDLAAALEAEPDDVMKGLKLRTKVDGQEGEATLAEVLKSFQLESALNKRLEAVAHERKHIAETLQQEQARLAERTQEADDMISALEQTIAAEFNDVDWNGLRATDPSEYVAKQEAFQNRYSMVQEFKDKIASKRQEEQKKTQDKIAKQHQAVIEQQYSMLLDKLPEWKDDESARKSEFAKARNYLLVEGASEDEVSKTIDHRIWTWAVKAMRYDDLQKKAGTKTKQLKNKPKFIPPGKRRSNETVSAKRTQDALKKARKSQSTEDWTKAIQERLSL